MNFTVERKHIHDLANHLTIIQGAVRKVKRDLEHDAAHGEHIQRLEKADDYLKQSMEALRDLRQAIIEKVEASS